MTKSWSWVTSKQGVSIVYRSTIATCVTDWQSHSPRRRGSRVATPRFVTHAQVSWMEELQPPDEFPFPFQPYCIQERFMRALYSALERGCIGIFESPTGTVRVKHANEQNLLAFP